MYGTTRDGSKTPKRKKSLSRIPWESRKAAECLVSFIVFHGFTVHSTVPTLLQPGILFDSRITFFDSKILSQPWLKKTPVIRPPARDQQQATPLRAEM